MWSQSICFANSYCSRLLCARGCVTGPLKRYTLALAWPQAALCVARRPQLSESFSILWGRGERQRLSVCLSMLPTWSNSLSFLFSPALLPLHSLFLFPCCCSPTFRCSPTNHPVLWLFSFAFHPFGFLLFNRVSLVLFSPKLWPEWVGERKLDEKGNSCDFVFAVIIRLYYVVI